MFRPEREDTSGSIQRCFKPSQIKSHREGLTPRPILKHRAELSGEASLAPLTSTSADQGVTSEAAKKEVRVISMPTFFTSVRHWAKDAITPWLRRRCKGDRCACPGDKEYAPDGEDWRKEQLRLGNDYLELLEVSSVTSHGKGPIPEAFGLVTGVAFRTCDVAA